MRGTKPSRMALYITALSLCALSLILFALARVGNPTPSRGVLVILFIGLLTAAYLFQIRIGPKARVSLSTTLLFASVLLFDPATAILVVASGKLLASAIRRDPPNESIFNTSQTVLQVGAGALLLDAARWDVSHVRLDHPQQLLMIAVAALVMYLINTLSVATIIGLESGSSPLLVWRQSIATWDPSEHLSQLLLGLLVAMVADAHPWALLLLVPPVLFVYRLHEQNTQLAYVAWHDSLTGLPNRVLFLDRLERSLSPGRGHQGLVAVLFVDLDCLKHVNDTLGHEAGDGLLVAVAERLKGCLRPEDTIARIGGDEFAVLLEGVAGDGEVTQVVERMLRNLREPLHLGGREVSATASIGVAMGTPGSDRPADLLRSADEAMYRAKGAGKARYKVYGA